MTTKEQTNLLKQQVNDLLELDIKRDIDSLATEPYSGTDENAAYQIQMMRKTQRMMNTAMSLIDKNFEELDEINRKLNFLAEKSGVA